MFYDKMTDKSTKKKAFDKKKDVFVPYKRKKARPKPCFCVAGSRIELETSGL